MSSVQQQHPKISHSKPPYSNTKSFRQSFSGSETDVSNSTSTENLTQEEKHVLRHSTRQEPQGEENTLNNIHHHHQQSSVGVNSTCSDRTLIIHNFTNSYNQYLSSNNGMDDGSGEMQTSKTDPSAFDKINLDSNKLYGLPNQNAVIPPPPHHSFCMMSHEPVITSNANQNLSILDSQAKAYRSKNLSAYYLNETNAIDANTKFENLYSHRSPVLDLHRLPPPPEYPKAASEPIQSKEENVKLCISEPDLADWNNRPRTHGCVAVHRDIEFKSETAQEMVEALSAENIALKEELGHYYKKVSKLQKVETEVSKVHNAHEELVKSAEKREKLERAVRMRLELEVKRLQENNKRVRDQLDIAAVRLARFQVSDDGDSALKTELHKRDMLISQLITQNKELVSTKERQEVELSAQRATLQEQRTHIDILDNALTNAQANVVKLEEECRKKHAYVERVTQLQKALTSLQAASEKREVMEKKLRSKLEKEIETLRKHKEGKPSSEITASKELEMKKQIRQHEEKIIALEAEVFKWEQRYLEESAMRQIAIDNASTPKDAKIAALERTSQESEKLIAEARTEKLKQMDELYQSQRKCADIETRIKDLESKLAEKEAMIRVLQKQSVDKNEVIQNAMLRSPRHSPHPSILHASSLSSTGPMNSSPSALPSSEANSSVFTTSNCNNTMNAGIKNLANPCSSTLSNIVHHQNSPSQSGIGKASDPSEERDEFDHSNASTPTNCYEKSLDEQLKDVESQLSSKDSIISALRAEKQKYPNHFWRV